MITVLTAPATLCLSKDPIVYELESDNYLVSAGLEAINYVSFTSAVTADTQLPLRWGGSVQTFVAKTSPTTSGAQFPTGNGGASYVQSLVSWFQANVYLSDDFTVSYALIGSAPSLVFSSKKKGSAYSFTKLDWASGKVDWVQQGGDLQRALNHCIQVRIWLRNPIGNGYDMVFGENLPTDDSGKLTIDVGEILQPYLGLTPDLPLWAGMLTQQAKRSIRGYYLQVADGFGSPVQLGGLTTLTTKYVALGGTGYGRSGRVPTLFFENSKYKALRLGPLVRVVIKDAPQWLTFLNEATPKLNVLVKMQVFYSDNTSTTITRTTVSTWAAWEKLLIEAGPVQCGVFEVNSAKVAVKYHIWLQQNTTVVSEVYSYVLNDNTYQYRKYFTYVNSLGAVDVLTVWGAQDGKTALMIESASKNLGWPYTIGDAEEVQYYAQFQQSYKCHVELDSRAQYGIFRDFLISNYRYRWYAGQCYPIGIMSNSFDEPAEDETLHFTDFEYKFLFTEDALLIP